MNPNGETMTVRGYAATGPVPDLAGFRAMGPRCQKKGYSKKEAQTVVNYRNSLRDKDMELRIYQCPCGYWHVTHKEDIFAS